MRTRRSRRQRLGAVVVATVAAGSALAVWAPAADAVSNIQTGYWSALPAAPQVPAGGYEVGSNPSGAHAVAAIRFTLTPGETVQKLNLKVAQADPAPQVSVEACQVAAKSASWQPPSGGGPGPLSSAPTPDCSGGVVGGALAADGASMTFDLSLMSFTGGSVNLLLQPGEVSTAVNSLPGAPGTTPASFDAAFDQLTAAQIEVTAGPPPSTGDTGSTGSTPVSQPASQPVAQPPSDTPSVSVPDTTTAQPPAAAPPVVAPQQQTAQQQPASTNTAAPLTTGKGTNWRLLFALSFLASDVLIVWFFMQNRPEAAGGAGSGGAGAAGPRPKLSIYDPPPAPIATTPAEPATV